MATDAVYTGCLPCLEFARLSNCPSWHYEAPEAACLVGDLGMLQYAIRNGARPGFFTVMAAVCNRETECLDWAVRNGCPVSPNDDHARPVFVRAFVGDILARAVARAEREAAARVLQAAFLKAYYDPARPLCRRRIARQFEELSRAAF